MEKKRVISTKEAPAAIGPYSQALVVNAEKGLLFISGQIPVNPADGTVAEGIEAQTHQVMRNIGAILREAGVDYSHVVKTTCLLANMDHFTAMNDVYASYFKGDCPARAAFAVVKLPKGVLVEIEAIAVL